jgi:hypothetical protein
MEIFIYILIDPRNNEIRYVGKTTNIYVRFHNHIAPSKLNDDSHKSKWIKKILSEGIIPLIQVLEITNEFCWKEKEKYWIKYYRDLGCDLTNISDGGIDTGDHNKKTSYDVFSNDIKNFDKIFITKKELDIIENIHDFKYQKLLFAILFMHKIELKKDFQYGIDKNLRSVIFRLFKSKISKKEFEFALELFDQYKLIKTVLISEKEFIQVLFAENEGKAEIIIDCNNIESFMENYIDYYGGELIYCSNCGKKILRTGRNHFLCNDCWINNRRESQRMRMYGFRHPLDIPEI